MEASHQEYVTLMNSRISRLEEEVLDLKAELGAIRTCINELFAGPYMPTETAILQAVFHPSKSFIQKVRERINKASI